MRRGCIILICIISMGLMMQACVPRPPDTHRPRLPMMPNQYSRYSSEKESTADKSWQDFFADRDLNRLIQRALAHNQALKIFEQEIQIANNQMMARQGAYYPKIGAAYGYQLEKFGDFTDDGATDAGTQFLPVPTVPNVLNNQQVNFFTTWEVDIWKKLRNARKSSYYRYLSTLEGRKFMVTHLVAEIANAYYRLIALDKQLIIIKQYIRTLERAQEVMSIQKRAARSTELAVKRFEAEVLKNKSRLYKIKQDIVIQENELNALVGGFPKKIQRSSKQLQALLPKKFKTGVPCHLLDNRPDVQKALLEMKASHIDIKVAKARFLPSLGITGEAGYQAFSAQYLFISPESIFYNLASNFSAPLLNRQAIKAAYFTANNKQIQAVYQYNRTVLFAYKEVANELVIIENLKKMSGLREKQVKALTASVEIVNLLFQAAKVDYLESLLVQRDFLRAQMGLVDVERNQLVAYVTLYKALGGGWRDSRVSQKCCNR